MLTYNEKMKIKLIAITLSSLILLPLFSFGILFLLPRPHFEIEDPRPQFWNYPSIDEAKYFTEVTADGKLRIEIEHPALVGVTPKMLSWWYQHLASGFATIEGKSYSYYHLFHLSEHGQTRIISAATDGSVGMGKGAIVYRQEKFGSYLSKGQGRVLEFSDSGFTIEPIFGPLSFGKIHHKFIESQNGSRYSVSILLGSDLPILGQLISYYIRVKQFPPDVVQEWIRHQVEEVGSLVHFLPDLYRDNQK